MTCHLLDQQGSPERCSAEQADAHYGDRPCETSLNVTFSVAHPKQKLKINPPKCIPTILNLILNIAAVIGCHWLTLSFGGGVCFNRSVDHMAFPPIHFYIGPVSGCPLIDKGASRF